MFLEILIALSCLLIQPTIHHYIGNLDECTASKICNHSWTPTCGHFEVESSYRLFLDDCDLHEYNCDNNTTYVEVEAKVCKTKCTQRDHVHEDTTPMTPTPPPQVSTTRIISTEETKTETPKITTIKEVTDSTIDKTDTSTIFVAPTTLEMTTEETKTTRQTSAITTKANATSVDTSTDVPTVEPVTETTTTTELTPAYADSNINDDENTIPEDSIESTSVATTTKPKPNCYPKRCTMPSTWETTAVGETRDFVQILRERYGDKIKFLRDTTHYPKNPMYARKSENFIPGYHMEKRDG